MSSLFQILMMLVSLAKFVIIAHVIMSWLINFQVLNLRQPLVWQIWNGLERLLNPVYSRIRSVLPSAGALDLAPLVTLVGIFVIEIVLRNNAALFF